MEKRTSLMVALDILNETREPLRKTQIVYRSNLNFNILKRWISLLINKGLFEVCNDPPRTWRTTEKGLKFIDAMEKVLGFWENEAIVLNDVKAEVVETGIFNSEV